MTPAVVAATIVGFLLLDAVIVYLIVGVVRRSLRPLNERFPRAVILPGAVEKRYQSFGFNMANYSGAIHVAVDEQHLHLTPVWCVKWVGLGPVSIPWSEIRLIRRGGRWRSAKVVAAGVTVTGPDWCLGLAEPGIEAPVG